MLGSKGLKLTGDISDQNNRKNENMQYFHALQSIIQVKHLSMAKIWQHEWLPKNVFSTYLKNVIIIFNSLTPRSD